MVFPTSGHTLGTSPWAKPRPKPPLTPSLKVAVNCILSAADGCATGRGGRFRSRGAARRTAGGVPHGGPTVLLDLKRCFPPLTCGSDSGPWSDWDGFCARAASSRHITGLEVRPVQCLHTATSRACLRVGRPARLDLLVAAGWNQAPARPADRRKPLRRAEQKKARNPTQTACSKRHGAHPTTDPTHQT